MPRCTESKRVMRSAAMLRSSPFVVFLGAALVGWVLVAVSSSGCSGGTALSLDDAGSNGGNDTGGASLDAKTTADGNGSIGPCAGPRQPVGKMTLIVRKLYIGETDRAGVKNPNAWKAFGRNVDGVVTTVTSGSSPDLAYVCRRRAGAPATIHQDGNQGNDNAWGKEFLKLLDPFSPTPTQVANDEITKGGRTAMISLDGNGGSLVYAEATSTPPTWAPSETRAVAAEWVTDNVPNSTFVKGGVCADGHYESGILGGTTRIILGSSGQDQPPFTVQLRAGVVRMKIADDDGSAVDGTISGIVSTEELVAEMTKMAGRFSTELCSGSTVEGIKSSIRQASDILLDGTQDPSKECDGITIGLGFEATRGEVGAVAPPSTPPPNPCP
jgi:hypothetical protein